nr:MAG TPA: protein of unknown function (DUF5408) [Caudoviricetes sp.]DAW91350.1 MAG TPA: protein of unknown function (DUF5408) [Caudoviricetes sp.]
MFSFLLRIYGLISLLLTVLSIYMLFRCKIKLFLS